MDEKKEEVNMDEKKEEVNAMVFFFFPSFNKKS